MWCFWQKGIMMFYSAGLCNTCPTGKTRIHSFSASAGGLRGSDKKFFCSTRGEDGSWGLCNQSKIRNSECRTTLTSPFWETFNWAGPLPHAVVLFCRKPLSSLAVGRSWCSSGCEHVADLQLQMPEHDEGMLMSLSLVWGQPCSRTALWISLSF